MKTSEIFLLMLDAAGGQISGKTLIHKRAYFLNVLLDLNLPYKPHYYGPYSAELDASIGQCKALGLVDQNSQGFGVYGKSGFEIRRFDYRLTDDGQVVLQDIKKRKPEECERILQCSKRLFEVADDDYVALSIAAKTFHILRQVGHPVKYDDIIKEAEQLGWEISEKSIDKAVEILSELKLVEMH